MPGSTSDTSGQSGTQALDRAIELVTAVVRADEPIAFADLQEACGLAKSTTSRMLGALERGSLVARESQGAYVAGSLFWLYAARHDPWEETIRLARPAMEEIGEVTGETVHLSVVRGDQVAQVAQVDARYLLGTRDWSEVPVPPHCSALAKVFWTWEAIPLPEGDLDQLTERTITTQVGLRRDAQAARRRGWTTTLDELEVGLTGLAVPIHGIHGDVVAALGLSGPTARLAERLDEFAHHLTDHATRLSSLLRGPAPKEGVA